MDPLDPGDISGYFSATYAATALGTLPHFGVPFEDALDRATSISSEDRSEVGSLGYFPLCSKTRSGSSSERSTVSPLRLGVGFVSRENTPLGFESIQTPHDLGAIPMTRDNTPIHLGFSDLGLEVAKGFDASSWRTGNANARQNSPRLAYVHTPLNLGDMPMTRDNTPLYLGSGYLSSHSGLDRYFDPASVLPPPGWPWQLHGGPSAEAHGALDSTQDCFAPAVVELAPPQPSESAMSFTSVSCGSVGHPGACAAPCKYAFRRGCKDGAACIRCHLCRWSREAEKQAKCVKGKTVRLRPPE